MDAIERCEITDARKLGTQRDAVKPVFSRKGCFAKRIKGKKVIERDGGMSSGKSASVLPLSHNVYPLLSQQNTDLFSDWRLSKMRTERRANRLGQVLSWCLSCAESEKEERIASMTTTTRQIG